MSQQTNKVVTPDEVRFSYAQVLAPRRGENDDEKPTYSTAILIPKTATKTLKAIKAAIEVAKETAKSKCWGGKIPANLKLPIRDGDEERPDDPAYAGMYFLNAKTTRKPSVIDVNRRQLEDPNEFYSGCWGKVSIDFYGYKHSGNVGVGVGLGNILKLRDDEALGGVHSDAFSDFADDLTEDENDSFFG